MANNYKVKNFSNSTTNTSQVLFEASASTTLVKSIIVNCDKATPSATGTLKLKKSGGAEELIKRVTVTSQDVSTEMLYDVLPLESGDKLYATSSDTDLNWMMSWVENNNGIIGAALDSLTDVDTTGVANGNVLTYNSTSGNWEPEAPAAGGDIFKTIAVAGQSSIVADSTTDTLTIAAGTGITLTTDATTDTLTITNSATGANAFGNVAVAGQTTVAADGTNDTLTLVAGTGVTITTDATTDSVTITNSVTAPNTFGTIAVATQSSVVADSTTDTLTLAAGAGIAITTDATTDTVTVASTINSFNNIAVSGQSNVIADSAGDTLTLVAAGGTTITTASVTDTITFSSRTLDDNDVTLSASRSIELNGEDFFFTSSSVSVVELTGGSVVLPDTTIRSTDGALSSSITLLEAPNNGGFGVTLQAPAQLTASTTFTLPSADGSNAQVLQTNGAGTLSFVSLMTTAATATVGAYLELKEAANNGINYIRLQAPATLAANKTYTLPATDGSNGDRLTTDGSGTLSWSAVTTGASYSTVRTQSGTTYTLVLGDAGDYIQTTSTTAVTITVPTQVSVTWAADTEIYFEQNNTGQITFVGASGVTINSSETLKTFARYSVVALKRVASDVWTLTGERALV